MIALLVGLPLLILAAVLQSTALVHLRVLDGTLDLTLLLVLGWTLAGDWRGGMLWGLMGGLCLDLLSGAPLGTAALGLVLMAYFASLTEGRFWHSHILLPLATILLGTVGLHLIYLIVLRLNGETVNVGLALARITLPTVVLNTAGMLPIYHAMRWLRRGVYPEPVEI
jgi:rod shape-determining protein MreD